jgi:hypothetical protein
MRTQVNESQHHCSLVYIRPLGRRSAAGVARAAHPTQNYKRLLFTKPREAEQTKTLDVCFGHLRCHANCLCAEKLSETQMRLDTIKVFGSVEGGEVENKRVSKARDSTPFFILPHLASIPPSSLHLLQQLAHAEHIRDEG